MSDLTPSLPAPQPEYLPAEVYVVRPPNPRYWLHILLFVATIFTTLVVGAKMEFDFLHNAPPFVHGDETLPLFPVGWALHEPSRLLLGIPFSATLLLILLAHEMGHYLYCRYYGVYATLPFFIPGADPDWHAGRCDSDTVSHPLALRVVRHRNRRPDRRICGRAHRAGDRDVSFPRGAGGDGEFGC